MMVHTCIVHPQNDDQMLLQVCCWPVGGAAAAAMCVCGVRRSEWHGLWRMVLCASSPNNQCITSGQMWRGVCDMRSTYVGFLIEEREGGMRGRSSC
jgi:hypothetical protein